MQFSIAAEEVFINIISYTKDPQKVMIQFWMDHQEANLSFSDDRTPFNPLLQVHPDLTKEAGKEQVGGLGIFMAKQLTDDSLYRYENGKNILTLIKYQKEDKGNRHIHEQIESKKTEKTPAFAKDILEVDVGVYANGIWYFHYNYLCHTNKTSP